MSDHEKSLLIQEQMILHLEFVFVEEINFHHTHKKLYGEFCMHLYAFFWRRYLAFNRVSKMSLKPHSTIDKNH